MNYPLAKFRNVEPARQELFTHQCLEYISYVLWHLESHSLGESLHLAHQTYRLKCHALDCLAYRASVRATKHRLTEQEAGELARDVCAAIQGMFGRDREALKERYEALSLRQANSLTIARVRDVSALHPCDIRGWDTCAGEPLKCEVVAINRRALEAPLAEAPALEEKKAPRSQIVLTKSQILAERELLHFHALHGRDPIVAGVHTRPIPLVVAPTGVGKTALVKHFAASRDLPLIELDPGSWICSGAYTRPSTFETLGAWMEKHLLGVILLDEVDKFGCDSEGSAWSRHVRQEVFSLLDKRLSGVPNWQEKHTDLLDYFFVVGCGTWQSVFSRKSAVGFGVETRNLKADIGKQDAIPPELLFRFNSRLIYLHPPTRDEYRARIAAMHNRLGMSLPPDLDVLASEAEASGQNTRWLEGYLSDLLRRRDLTRKRIAIDYDAPQLAGEHLHF
jgi:ATPase family protein associated with various cellular activities (AAA)